jgi:uncharacterized heparinase superfamily protein
MARAPQPLPAAVRVPFAALAAVGRQMQAEWRAGALHRLAISHPRPTGLAVRPRDPRPADAARGERLLAGRFTLAGETLDVGPGDPWGSGAPSRRFASALHGFVWTPDLMATGEAGARETLRLWLEWRRLFGRFNAFAWTGLALERRVFHLAIAAPALLPLASEAEGAALLDGLARQARHLLTEPGDPGRAAERAAVAALAGAVLAGAAGDGLLARALPQLDRLLAVAVLPEGVHASRSPERVLELLFDLTCLDDALSQRGAPAPAEAARAIDRLATATRFFALADGRLPAFQGGEPVSRERVATALAVDAAASPPAKSAPYGGYHRLEGRGLQVMVDTGAAPAGAFAGDACAQLCALTVLCDGRRLVEGSAWSAKADVGGALRGPAGGSCLTIGEAWPGAVLRHGLLAGGLESRLEGGPAEVKVEWHETADAAWLDLAHDGWRGAGLAATRRLFLDMAAGELRGEDLITCLGRPLGERLGYVVRFHLSPGVAASIAADGKSALLRPAGGAGWRLRSDSAGVRLDPSAAFEDGEARATQVLSLVGLVLAPDGARVRWKLSRDAP